MDLKAKKSLLEIKQLIERSASTPKLDLLYESIAVSSYLLYVNEHNRM